MKVFFLYTSLIFVLVITGFLIKYSLKSIENYYLITRIYNITEYSALAYFLSLYIKNGHVKKVLLYSPIPFVLICLFDYLSSKEPSIPFMPLLSEYFILLIFILFFFYELMQSSIIEPIYTKAIFWICSAFIINFSGNFFLFIYSKNSFNDLEFQKQYTVIYTTVTVIKNILLCIGVLIKETKDDNQTEGYNMKSNPINSFKT